MSLDEASSLRLSVLRFPLILGVLFIHAYSDPASVATNHRHAFGEFIEKLISLELARASVPLFFLMSGYLYFLGFDGTLISYRRKTSSRIKTLLIPFLFWNVLVLGAIALAQNLPATSVYFSGKTPFSASLSNFTPFELMDAVIGIDRSPIAYQFWFIRDLIVLALIAPLVDRLSRAFAVPFIVVLLLFWFTDFWPLFFPSIEAVFFFSLGAVLVSRRLRPCSVDAPGSALVIGYLVLGVIATLTLDLPYSQVMSKLVVLLGAGSIIYLSKFLCHPALRITLSRLGESSFFIFAAHEPLMTFMRKFVATFCERHSTYGLQLTYFTLPVAAVLVLLCVSRLLAYVPRFFAFITGGQRLPAPTP